MYHIEYSVDAIKALRSCPVNVRVRIKAKIVGLAANLDVPNNNVKKLKGRPGYRLRVGDWRVIYDLSRKDAIVFVEQVGPRGSIYE